MRITRSRRFTVNMGEYESFSFGGEVSADHTDLGIADEEVAHLSQEESANLQSELFAYVMETLEDIERDDAQQAAEFTGNSRSFIKNALAVKPKKRARRA